MILEKTQTKNNSADLTNLENSHLSIQLSLNGFVYCIFDKDEVDIVFLKEYEFLNRAQTPEQLLDDIKEVYKLDTVLENKFETVSVSHRNNLATIVPAALYDKAYKSDYLKYTVKVLENDFISEDSIAENDIMSIYIPFQNVNEYLDGIYDSISYSHSSSILIASLLKYHKHNPYKQFFINVSKNSLDIIYLHNNKLELFNSFLYYTKEDFLYYVLFAMEQLVLNADEHNLTFIGDINKESELYTICYTYVRNINFLKIKNYSISEEFYINNPHIEEHQFFELLNQF